MNGTLYDVKATIDAVNLARQPHVKATIDAVNLALPAPVMQARSATHQALQSAGQSAKVRPTIR